MKLNSIKNINGISASYTDELKIGFFKIKHKITYNNEFFGINITYKCRHAKDAKRLCEAEFNKQLNHII